MRKLDSNEVYKLSVDELNRVCGEATADIISRIDPVLYLSGYIQALQIEPHVANAGYDIYYTACFDKNMSTGCDTPQEAVIDLAFKMNIELYTYGIETSINSDDKVDTKE